MFHVSKFTTFFFFVPNCQKTVTKYPSFYSMSILAISDHDIVSSRTSKSQVSFLALSSQQVSLPNLHFSGRAVIIF